MINSPAFNKPLRPTGLAGLPKANVKLGEGRNGQTQGNKPGVGSKPKFDVDGFKKAIDPSQLQLPKNDIKLGQPKPWNPMGTGEGLGKEIPKIETKQLGGHGAGCACCCSR